MGAIHRTFCFMSSIKSVAAALCLLNDAKNGLSQRYFKRASNQLIKALRRL